MTAAAVLVALAAVILWCPPGRVQYRLREVATQDRQTGQRMAPGFIAAVVGPVIGLAVAGPAGLITAAIVVAVIGWRQHRRRQAKTAEHRRADLLSALTLMIAELSVGAPPARACATAATDLTHGPIADGLAALAARAELGGSIVKTADVSTEPTPWQPIAAAWDSAERHGLPLAELLGSLRADIAARQAFAARTQAGLAGPRATALVLAGLPLLGIALGQATGANPLAVLTGGGLGGILLMLGTTLAALGIVWSERITDKAVRA